MNRFIKQVTLRVALVLAIFGGLAASQSSSVQAQDQMYRMKSIFIYNFTKYINWSQLGNEFVIGVFDDEVAFNNVTTTFQGRSVAGKPVQVIRLSNPASASGCSLVYLTAGAGHHASALMAPNRLVITDDDVAGRGSMISFLVRNSKLTFKIATEDCQKNGLAVASQLVNMGIEI